MRQQDVMRETAWKIKNWEATRQAQKLRPEHFGVALGRISIHGQTTMATNPQATATLGLVSASTSPTIDPDESLWPRG